MRVPTSYHHKLKYNPFLKSLHIEDKLKQKEQDHNLEAIIYDLKPPGDIRYHDQAD
jgi:hypothetical protein